MFWSIRQCQVAPQLTVHIDLQDIFMNSCAVTSKSFWEEMSTSILAVLKKRGLKLTHAYA